MGERPAAKGKGRPQGRGSPRMERWPRPRPWWEASRDQRLGMQMRPLPSHTRRGKNLQGNGNVSCLGRETNKRAGGNKRTKIAEERSMPGTRGAHSSWVQRTDKDWQARGQREGERQAGERGQSCLRRAERQDKDAEERAVSMGRSEPPSRSAQGGQDSVPTLTPDATAAGPVTSGLSQLPRGHPGGRGGSGDTRCLGATHRQAHCPPSQATVKTHPCTLDSRACLRLFKDCRRRHTT